MTDIYSQITIIVRIISLVLFGLFVYRRQFKLLKYPELRRDKLVLFGLVTIIILGNVLSIALNFFRQSDGNLLTAARHISSIWNACSSLSTALAFTFIYRKEDK